MQPYLDAIKQADGNINRFDLITPAPLADTLESLYVVAGTAYAEAMYNAIQPPTKATKEILRAGWRDFMRLFAVRNLPQTLIQINETSQRIIRAIVLAGLNEGLGALQIATNIQESISLIFRTPCLRRSSSSMVRFVSFVGAAPVPSSPTTKPIPPKGRGSALPTVQNSPKVRTP